MNDFVKQTEELLKNGPQIVVPETVQKAAQDGLDKTHETYTKVSAAAQDAGKAFEKVYETAQKGSKTLTEKFIDQAAKNTDAAFKTARAVLKSKSVPEAAQLQAEYLNKQIEIIGNQSKELYELSSKITADTLKTLSTATNKAFDQSK